MTLMTPLAKSPELPNCPLCTIAGVFYYQGKQRQFYQCGQCALVYADPDHWLSAPRPLTGLLNGLGLRISSLSAKTWFCWQKLLNYYPKIQKDRGLWGALSLASAALIFSFGLESIFKLKLWKYCLVNHCQHHHAIRRKAAVWKRLSQIWRR